VDRIRGWGKVVSDSNSMQLGMGGVDVDTETALTDVLQVTSGDLMNLRGNNTVLLFESQADKLEVQVGDEITLSAPTVRGANNSLDVTVAAIAKNIGFMSGFSVFVPKAVLRDIYLMDDKATGAIQIYLSDHEKADEVAETLRGAVQDAGYEIMEPEGKPFWTKFQVVTREGWTGQRIDVTTWKDELGFLTMSLDAFRGLTIALTLVLMLIVIVGVMNSMWMSIRERTREIGTLRAIGMQRGGIGSMFVIEAATLSVLGSVVGALLGIALTLLLNGLHISIPRGAQLFLMRDTLFLETDPTTVFVAVAVISCLVTLFSLFPAVKAARMRPVTAMHHAG
ncbi:MAG: FtsX-like permease family protein, partial [Myxococcota bacterium]|nr:FtsX-like permease family protein [Myxococcota bacterium]